MEIKRDGEFRSLGLLSHDRPQMLVRWYDPRFFAALSSNPHISCVITSPDLLAQVPETLAVATCDDPSAAFYRIHDHLLAATDFYGPQFASEIAPSAVIDPAARVAPRNVRIGPRTRIGPCAVILERTEIGSDCTIGPGAVIGGEGFEPKYVEGRHVIVRHAGGVHIGDRVEVYVNTNIAKAVFNGATEIGDDTKIDALVHIAHNVRIGQRCEIAAHAHIAGSSTVGDEVWIGPAAVVSSEVKVGRGAFIAVGSLVLRDVADNARIAQPPSRSWS
jgi:UDP-3-O-[3-hydroxymyristoyl] glucosamine N-acyltransferase